MSEIVQYSVDNKAKEIDLLESKYDELLAKCYGGQADTLEAKNE